MLYFIFVESLACDFDEPSLCGYQIVSSCDTISWISQLNAENVTIRDNYVDYMSDQGKKDIANGVKQKFISNQLWEESILSV